MLLKYEEPQENLAEYYKNTFVCRGNDLDERVPSHTEAKELNEKFELCAVSTERPQKGDSKRLISLRKENDTTNLISFFFARHYNCPPVPTPANTYIISIALTL